MNFLNTYNYLPLQISRGEGVYLIDEEGNKYLDMFAGLAVNALGYAHPGITAAVSKQISEYSHVSNFFLTNIQSEFAGKAIKIFRNG
jgi:acetylornithine/N-succinyldiaminopimelate aminotransferase